MEKTSEVISKSCMSKLMCTNELVTASPWRHLLQNTEQEEDAIEYFSYWSHYLR